MFSIYTCMLKLLKQTYFDQSIHENQIQNIKLVCVVHLSISTILIFTNGSKHTKLGYLSLLDDLHLQVDPIQNSVIHRALSLIHI